MNGQFGSYLLVVLECRVCVGLEKHGNGTHLIYKNSLNLNNQGCVVNVGNLVDPLNKLSYIIAPLHHHGCYRLFNVGKNVAKR